MGWGHHGCGDARVNYQRDSISLAMLKVAHLCRATTGGLMRSSRDRWGLGGAEGRGRGEGLLPRAVALCAPSAM